MTKSKNDIRNKTSRAGEWFVRLKAEPITCDTDAEFRTWLEQDLGHEAAYERCEVALELARELRDDPDLQPHLEECADLVANHKKGKLKLFARSGNWFRFMPIAASFAAVTLAVLITISVNLPTTYKTHVGEQRTVVLPDRSIVELNTKTELSVNYKGNERSIRLKEGEAFFSVQPDKERPFKVYAGNGISHAVGTAFDVSIDKGKIIVSVLEGNVDVITDRLERSPSSDNAEPPRLKGGQSVIYWENGAIAQVEKAYTRRINAWREGKLEFYDTRLADAISEYNRYTRQKIVIGSDALKNLSISGIVKIGDTDSLIFLLEKSLGLQSVKQPDIIILVSQKQESI